MKAMKAKNIDNTVLTLLFHDLDMDNLFGSGTEDNALPVRLDKVTKIVEEDRGSEG